MVLLLATLLTAAPVNSGGRVSATLQTQELRTQFDWFGLITSAWYVPQSRVHLEAALGSLKGETDLNGQGLLRATPVVGPWITAAAHDSALADSDRMLLAASGLMQLAGITLGTLKLLHLQDQPLFPRPGPVLRISPIASGRLGISVRIVGF